jgi:hypothetical protein
VAFYEVACEPELVTLGWTVASLDGIEGFNIYRATSGEATMILLNREVIPPSTAGEYEDTTTWPETTFLYELRAVAPDGTEEAVGDEPLAVTTGGRLVAVLHPPRPNPFESTTTVQFDVPSHDRPVAVTVYDVRGRVVRVLHDGPIARGRHTLVWDGRDARGSSVSSGVYFVRLILGDDVSARKMMLLR